MDEVDWSGGLLAGARSVDGWEAAFPSVLEEQLRYFRQLSESDS